MSNTPNLNLIELIYDNTKKVKDFFMNEIIGKINSNNIKIDAAIAEKITQVALKKSLPTLPSTTNNLYIVYDDTNENNGQYRWNGIAYEKVSTQLDYATQAEAEGGTDNTKVMTPLRTSQLVDIKVGDSVTEINNKIKIQADEPTTAETVLWIDTNDMFSDAFSANNVSIVDKDNKFTSSTVEGALRELDTKVNSHITSIHAPSNAQKNSDITKSEIEDKLTGEISSHSHASAGDMLKNIYDTKNKNTDIFDYVDNKSSKMVVIKPSDIFSDETGALIQDSPKLIEMFDCVDWDTNTIKTPLIYQTYSGTFYNLFRVENANVPPLGTVKIISFLNMQITESHEQPSLMATLPGSLNIEIIMFAKLPNPDEYGNIFDTRTLSAIDLYDYGVATDTVHGVVCPDNTTITVDDYGTISAVSDTSKANKVHSHIGTEVTVTIGTDTKSLNDFGTSMSETITSIVQDLLSKAPTYHTSNNGNLYGSGSSMFYGHLRLMDSINASQNVDSGVAATPLAVRTVNQAVLTKAPNHQSGTTAPSAFVGEGVLYGVHN